MNIPDEYPENVLVNESNENLMGLSEGELCQDYGIQNKNQCLFTAKKKNIETMTMAYMALKMIKKQRNEGDYLEFVNSFNQLGKVFVENKFISMLFLKLIGFIYQPSSIGPAKFSQERKVEVDGKLIRAPFEVKISIRAPKMAQINKTLKAPQQ